MSLDFFSQFGDPLFLVKIIFLVFLLFYAVFSLVIFNQAVVMERIVRQASSSSVIKLFAVLNILLAFSLFLISLAIL